MLSEFQFQQMLRNRRGWRPRPLIVNAESSPLLASVKRSRTERRQIERAWQVVAPADLVERSGVEELSDGLLRVWASDDEAFARLRRDAHALARALAVMCPQVRSVRVRFGGPR